VKVARAHGAQLRHAQAGGVEELEHGAVAQPERIAGVGALDELHALRFGERARELAVDLGGLEGAGEILGQDVALGEELQEAADGDDAPEDGGTREAGFARPVDVGDKRFAVDPLRPLDADPLVVGGEIGEVARVRGNAVRTQAALERDVVQEVVDPMVHAAREPVPPARFRPPGAPSVYRGARAAFSHTLSASIP
jgi:hypothetical protein